MRREVVFAGLKSINQSAAHLRKVSKEVVRERAAVTGMPTIIYQLISSASKRMEEVMPLTMSFI